MLQLSSESLENLGKDFQALFLHRGVLGVSRVLQSFHELWVNCLNHVYSCFIFELFNCAPDGERENVPHFLFTGINHVASEVVDDHDEVLVHYDGRDLLNTFDSHALHIRARVLEVLDKGSANSLFRGLFDFGALREPKHLRAKIHGGHVAEM